MPAGAQIARPRAPKFFNLPAAYAWRNLFLIDRFLRFAHYVCFGRNDRVELRSVEMTVINTLFGNTLKNQSSISCGVEFSTFAHAGFSSPPLSLSARSYMSLSQLYTAMSSDEGV